MTNQAPPPITSIANIVPFKGRDERFPVVIGIDQASGCDKTAMFPQPNQLTINPAIIAGLIVASQTVLDHIQDGTMFATDPTSVDANVQATDKLQQALTQVYGA